MRRLVLPLTGFVFSTTVLAQSPTAIPATGYAWVKTGTGQYAPDAVSTVPNIVSGSTNFGAPDLDPVSCANACGGNCDGSSKYFVSLFGFNNTTPVGTNTNCEQRAIQLKQWTNDFPNAAVTNGATAGKVYLPTTATVTLKKSPANLTPGCGAGSSGNVGRLFGGTQGITSTRVNVQCNYNLKWSSAAFGGLIDGGQSWSQSGSFFAQDPGTGNTSAEQAWHNGGFGNTIPADVAYNIPVAAISQTGDSFEINITSNPSLTITREMGNADAIAESSPGMEGLAEIKVAYDVWEIVNVVPLRLTQFSAQWLQNGKALLKFTNEAEYQNQRYNIQRSYNGRHWQLAGTLTAQQNAPLQKASYQFIDDNVQPTATVVFYRISVIENNGGVMYSSQAMLRNGRQAPLSLLPTGNTNEYRLITSTPGRYQVLVHYITGQQAARYSLDTGNGGNTLINFNHLPAGIYAVSLQQQQQREVIKILVTH
jgi:hypothetical protein